MTTSHRKLARHGHDFSVGDEEYRLCARCALPDITAVRSKRCVPLHPAQAEAECARKLLKMAEIKGRPSGKLGNA